MSNTIITPSLVAKAAVKILNNELVMANRVYRGYEDDFGMTVNGYKPGATVNVRRPGAFTVRVGANASAQDLTEGVIPITVNRQIGVDFAFTSTDLTLSLSDLAERAIRPAMVKIANQMDQDVHGLFVNVPNWVGTAGNTISTFAKFMAGVQRLNEGAVDVDDRAAIISPADHAALVANQTTFLQPQLVESAYRKGALGTLADIDTYMTQNAPTLTTGSRTNGTVNGANQATTYTPNSYTQTLNVTGLGAAGTVSAGEVFTIAGVFAVNPVTKAQLPYLKQFTVTAAATADGSGNAALTISPQIVTSGAFQTVSGAPANTAAVTWVGSASTSYTVNQFMHRNAHALVVVPMVKPPGAVQVARETFKNLSVRIVPFYNGSNDTSTWRLDVLYGYATIDPRLSCRVSG